MSNRETYKEIAERTDQEFLEGREMEGYEPTELHLARSPGASLTIRLAEADFAVLRRHAKANGLNMSEFAREALMKAVATDTEDPLTGLVAGAQRLATLAKRVETSRTAAGSALTARPKKRSIARERQRPKAGR
jgi:predicted DNA binding CopG/RHH family protein